MQRPDGTPIADTTSDDSGNFVFVAPRDGRYRLFASAQAYDEVSLEIELSGSVVPPLHVGLSHALRAIGATVTHSNERARSSSGDRVSAGELAAGGRLRLAEGLATVPGVTVSGDALAPAGDAYVSLRGLRPGESQALLDGHPVGPIGVAVSAPDADGTVAGFNYQAAPYFAIRSADVSFGSEATGLFGAGGIGGSVDLRTLDPTPHPALAISQGLGTEGRAFSTLRATGRTGYFGFAFAYGVTGTYGLFAPQTIAQTGLRGTDFTSTTLRDVTYNVTGNYVLRNGLAKVSYAAPSGTSVTLTAYDATSWSDKTGEGDNDYSPYAYTLASAPIGADPTCPRGVLVTANAGPSCLSRATYASSAAGPAGGGPGTWQAFRNSDYDLKITGPAASGMLTLDAFSDAYSFLYHRDASSASGPLDAFLDRWSTAGVRLGTEYVVHANDVAFGAAFLHETLSGDATNADGSAFEALARSGRTGMSAYVRDVLAPASPLSLSLDAALKSSTGDATLHFEPRLALDYRPATRDTLRLSLGRSTEEPSLQTNRTDLLPVGAINPNCGAIASATQASPAEVEAGSGPTNGLASEAASNLELHYGHDFGRDARFGVTFYDTHVTNRIVEGELSAGDALSTGARASLQRRIVQFCGVNPAPGTVTFTVGRAFNAATARVRGIEIAGRTNVATRLALDYSYDVQSVVLGDLPNAVLATDPTLVNGAQAFEVPLHKATLGLELATRGGLHARIEGHAVGPGNPQQLPGYAYADASLAANLSQKLTLGAAASNVFNSHAQKYGLVGFGLPYATNVYHASLTAPFLQPFNERYGLAPASLVLSATLHM